MTLLKNVSNETVGKSKTIHFGVNEEAYQGVLSGFCVLAVFTIISNLAVLTASKFTTAGHSATLVFIRSLCIADVVIGFFGIFKALLLNHLDSIMINCFLPESLFVSASMTLSLTLLWLNCDSYLRLTQPLTYGNSMDKSNVINSMMFVWNLAFILGFMPQMGWSQDQYSCNVFDYYDDAYLRLICSIWMLCMIISCILQYKLHKVRQQVLQNSHFLSPNSQEFKKFSKLIVTIRIDIVIWILCYLPLLIYLLLYCNSCSMGGTKMANINLFFFMPIFLIRSFVSAFIHSYRTIKIQQAMRNISRRISNTILHKGSLSSEEGASSNRSCNSNQSGPTLNNVSKTASHLGTRAHEPLKVTSSNVTIDSTLEEIVMGHNCDIHESPKGNNSIITDERNSLKVPLPTDLIRNHTCIVHGTPMPDNYNTAKQTIHSMRETLYRDVPSSISKIHKCPVHDNPTGPNFNTATEEVLDARMTFNMAKDSGQQEHKDLYKATIKNPVTVKSDLKSDKETNDELCEHISARNLTTAEMAFYTMKELIPTILNTDQDEETNTDSRTSSHQSERYNNKTLGEVKESIVPEVLIPDVKILIQSSARTHKRLERSPKILERKHTPLELMSSLVASDSKHDDKPTTSSLKTGEEKDKGEKDNPEVLSTNL